MAAKKPNFYNIQRLCRHIELVRTLYRCSVNAVSTQIFYHDHNNTSACLQSPLRPQHSERVERVERLPRYMYQSIRFYFSCSRALSARGAGRTLRVNNPTAKADE